MTHEAGVFDAVQQHVGDAQHVRQLLFLHGVQAGLHGLLVFYLFHVAVTHVTDGTGEKAAGAAGGIEQGFAGSGVDAVHHEGGDSARGVVLTGVAGALQVVQQLLVDVAKVLALGQIVEIHAAKPVNHLAHELAGLHVVVGVLEHIAHHAAAVGVGAADGQCLELREQGAVDEFEKCIAGDALGVGSPGAPLQGVRDRRAVIEVEKFEFQILVVDDLQKKHPA